MWTLKLNVCGEISVFCSMNFSEAFSLYCECEKQSNIAFDHLCLFLWSFVSDTRLPSCVVIKKPTLEKIKSFEFMAKFTYENLALIHNRVSFYPVLYLFLCAVALIRLVSEGNRRSATAESLQLLFLLGRMGIGVEAPLSFDTLC